MPLFTYTCPNCKETFDETRRIAERNDPANCPKCGLFAPRDSGAEIRGTHVSSGTAVWLSEAMGCQPEEVPEFRKAFPGSEYTDDGRLVCRGLKHRDAEIKRRGYVDYK